MSKRETINLLFGGDFAPCGAYESLIIERGGEILENIHKTIENADFTIFNLETPICESGKPIKKTGPALRAAPATLNALSTSNVDAVCLANNHILDYGPDGLTQTITELDKRGIRHVGAGNSRENAEAALRITIKGRRVSIFSVAEQEFNVCENGREGAAILDPLRMAPQLLAERDHADAIVVCVHGGNEYFPYPRPGLRRICQFLIEIGADAVIGHHPHVPGPYEIYHGKPIVYSLGNLVFDKFNPPPEWDQGYLASIFFNFDADRLNKIDISLIPYNQSVAHGGVRLLEGGDRDRFLMRIEKLRKELELHPQKWLDAWRAFYEQRRDQVIIDLSSPLRFRGLRRLMKFDIFRNFVAPPSRRRHRLNILRCDSHRELLIEALKYEVEATNFSTTPSKPESAKH